MSDLPDGWAQVPLEIVGAWGSGGTPTRTNEQYYAKEGIPWLVIGDLNDRVVVKSSNFITELGLINSSAKLVPAGTLLVAMYGSIGKLGITGFQCATNQAIAFCKPNESIVSLRYLYHAMFNAKPDLLALGQGGAQQNISQTVLKEFHIPLAPKNEQTRIANQLDTLLTRIHSCNDRFDAMPALFKRFRQVVLTTAHAGALTADWRLKNGLLLAEIAQIGRYMKVSSGNFLPAKDMASDGTIPVFGGNGINGHHNQANVHEETLVIGRVGFYCGSIHFTPKDAWITDNALLVRHDSQETDRKYLFYALQAVDLRENDSATAQPVISGQKIYPLPLRVPTLAEQLEIVRRVEALFALADRIETRATAARTHAQRLSPLVLAKAFRGELVPQDPQDEPASVLLTRIAAERSTSAPLKASRGRKPKGTPHG